MRPLIWSVGKCGERCTSATPIQRCGPAPRLSAGERCTSATPIQRCATRSRLMSRLTPCHATSKVTPSGLTSCPVSRHVRSLPLSFLPTANRLHSILSKVTGLSRE